MTALALIENDTENPQASPQISVMLLCAQHEKAGNAFQDWL